MKRKPIVYLICGFIGAGKTTFAKKLEEKTGAVKITKDEWSIRLIGNDPTIDGYAQWDRKIIDLSRDVAFYLAGKGIDVIMDEGFWEKETRDEMRRRADAMMPSRKLCKEGKETNREREKTFAEDLRGKEKPRFPKRGRKRLSNAQKAP
jgi:predicted kinase